MEVRGRSRTPLAPRCRGDGAGKQQSPAPTISSPIHSLSPSHSIALTCLSLPPISNFAPPASLQVESTDSKWQPAFLRGMPETVHKVADVDNFAMYWNPVRIRLPLTFAQPVLQCNRYVACHVRLFGMCPFLLCNVLLSFRPLDSISQQTEAVVHCPLTLTPLERFRMPRCSASCPRKNGWWR